MGKEKIFSIFFSFLLFVYLGGATYQLNSRQTIILKYALHNSEVTIQNCEAMLPDVSRRTLQRDLKTMLDKKLLLASGNTDRRIYLFNQ